MSEAFPTPEDRHRAIRCGIAVALLVGVSVFFFYGLTRPARGETLLPHPHGCPARAFCACGASVKVFGQSIRKLWPSSAWLRFPRAYPGHMKVAAKYGHVFVIDYMIDATTAMAWDFNSGGHKSRYHARSIRGYRIVDPQAVNVAGAR